MKNRANYPPEILTKTEVWLIATTFLCVPLLAIVIIALVLATVAH